MRVDIAAIIMAFCLAGAARGEATCQMREIGELPVKVGGDVTIDAQVNGRPVRMIVDTGSADTLLTHPAAALLGLVLRPIRGVNAYGIGGRENGASARIREFRVANLVNRDFDMLVQGPHPFGDAQGVLGALFLLQTDVEFDFPHEKLRFFRIEELQGRSGRLLGIGLFRRPHGGIEQGRDRSDRLSGRKADPRPDEHGSQRNDRHTC